jgi:hypothetical protein
LGEIDSDLRVGFLKWAPHEWQGVLITDERKASTAYFTSVDRLNPTRTGIQLDEVVIPHDVENWQASVLEQVCQQARFVPVCFFRRVEAVEKSEQVTGQDDSVDFLLPRDVQEPDVDRLAAMHICRCQDPHWAQDRSLPSKPNGPSFWTSSHRPVGDEVLQRCPQLAISACSAKRDERWPASGRRSTLERRAEATRAGEVDRSPPTDVASGF